MSGQWLPIETTMGTTTVRAPFAAACARGKETFESAFQSRLFQIVSIADMRARGVTPPALADPGENVLARWKIVVPSAADSSKGSGTTSARQGPVATIVSVRKEPNVEHDGLEGIAFHVHLKITGARGVPCHVLVGCLDASNELVKTELDDYQSSQGHLTNVVPVTPEEDEAEWDDLVLFLPYEGFELDPGTHPVKAVIMVGSEAKPLTQKPTLVPFKIIKDD
jgi:hypothetical protein